MSLPVNRLPIWLKQEIPGRNTRKQIDLLAEFKLNTVCKEAKCPNISNCFNEGKLTFMILGKGCTRNCQFCGVDRAKADSLALDKGEPARIIQAIERFGLKYVVITSVTRDDLLDGGAGQFAAVIKAIHGLKRNITVEVLIPDFKGNISSLATVLKVYPDVVAHNIETTSRLYRDLKPQSDYMRSLEVLSNLKLLNPATITKSSILLGLGESSEEVEQTMRDLRKSKCDILTLGQYLAPSAEHYSVCEFIRPEQFAEYRKLGLALGFKAVLSGPLVRSSYRAEELYSEIKKVDLCTT